MSAFLASTQAWALQPGVNLSGLEINPGALPGQLNYDFTVPTAAELDYYHGLNINLIRLPVLWERLQPGLLNGRQNPGLKGAYLNLIRGFLQLAATRSMSVIIDIHDYGGYGTSKIGGGAITVTQFADFWTRLARAIGKVPGLAAYDLMNEPSNMPSAAVWPQAAQAAVTAIRAVDAATPILVEGDDWAGAQNWQTVNAGLAITDPSNLITYEAHVYGDRDGSGTHFVWSQEEQYGVTTQTIAARLTPFTTWCQTMAVTCMIGEVGVGNDDPDWNTELAAGLAAASTAGLQAFTYWAGGPWWGSYPMSIEPQGNDAAVQMEIVAPYGGP